MLTSLSAAADVAKACTKRQKWIELNWTASLFA